MFIKIKSKVKHIDDWDDKITMLIVRNITNKEFAYVRDEYSVNKLMLLYPHYAIHMAVAEEKYFPTLIGYLLNKKKTMARLKAHRLYVIIE